MPRKVSAQKQEDLETLRKHFEGQEVLATVYFLSEAQTVLEKKSKKSYLMSILKRLKKENEEKNLVPITAQSPKEKRFEKTINIESLKRDGVVSQYLMKQYLKSGYKIIK